MARVAASLKSRAQNEESLKEYTILPSKLPSKTVLGQSIWQKAGSGLRSLFKKSK